MPNGDYIKQNFKSGDILYAAQLNAMDDEIKRLSNDRQAATQDNYVTPEMYGAKSDGINDDGPALKAALESDKPVKLIRDLYVFSRISVVNHNVELDGQGHTIHMDLSSYIEGMNSAALAIHIAAEKLPEGQTGPLKVIYSTSRDPVWKYWYPDADDSHGTDTYGYGYLSYKNEVPVPAWILDKMGDDTVIDSYPEYGCTIRNLTLHGVELYGHYGIALRYLCHVRLDNVCSYCEPYHDGTVGIWVSRCYDALIENCRTENWGSSRTWDIFGNNGYGLQPTGDKIVIRNYTGRNNHENLNVAGDRYIWTTRCLCDGIFVSYDASYPDGRNVRPGGNGTKKDEFYWTIFNAHADAICPIFNNVYVEAYNHRNRELIGLRCPDAILNNIHVNSPNNGFFAFSEYPERIQISNMVAPNFSFRCYGNGNWAVNPKQKDINLVNCYIKEVERFDGGVTLRMTNCIVQDKIWNASHLVMTNCKVLGDRDWLSMKTVIVLEDAQIDNCEIWANKSKFTNEYLPVIDCPENKLMMSNTVIKLLPDHVIFNNQQDNISNIRTEHRFGLVLNSDYSMLDSFYPF